MLPELQAHQEQVGRRENKDPVVNPVKEEQLENLVNQDYPVKLETMVLQGDRVLLVMTETVVMQVLQAFLDSMDLLDYQETREHKEHRAILEIQVK